MLDCVVVGAGPAGLAASVALAERGIEHEVLEGHQVAHTWRTQRWDAFRLNSPGWANRMLDPQPRDAYLSGAEVVERLVALSACCPVREGVRVDRLAPAGEGFALDTDGGEIRARTVVVATGHENVPRTPTLARALPEHIRQCHVADYRYPAQLPDGVVVVVGSGQSGCQISEELLAAGRSVVLATSPVGRVPTPYRGRDSTEWMFESGFFDQLTRDLPDPAMALAPQPVLAPGGRALSLQMLARSGATLGGRLVAVDGKSLVFDHSAASNVAAGDAFAVRARRMIDEFIHRSGVDAPPAEPDVAGAPVELDPPLRLPVSAIGSVLWCTGFAGSFASLDPALLNRRGEPSCLDAAGPVPGLWYIGLRWLTHRWSGVLPGFPKDAATVADAVAARLRERAARSLSAGWLEE